MPSSSDLIPEVEPTAPAGLTLLRSMWEDVLQDPNAPAEEIIAQLITCPVVSIRYALLTQLLGKAVDPSRDVLSIQRGDAATAQQSGRWDARSFCSANVVPWVSESGQVLGTSPDPYVNNPLRRARLDSGHEPMRDQGLWNSLVAVLNEVQTRNNPRFTASKLRSCLVSLATVYRQLVTEFDVPQRISLDATSQLVASFLAEHSGGERPQIVTAALMRTIGESFGIFDRVVRLGINEADAASDSPGDVICYKEGIRVLAVEVKDRTIEIHDVESAIGKARRSSVTEILFATVGPPGEDNTIAERMEREFALGINIYRMNIDALLRTSLSIAGEPSRVQFVTLVGTELNDRVTQPVHKLVWQSLLQNL